MHNPHAAGFLFGLHLLLVGYFVLGVDDVVLLGANFGGG
ncbi:unannotated protein [freshwater metagenome]|uniref:Unannotated protein n=1 Tax=freshwater metagenome TaxID=449393 RepID=A0A6J7KN34_9ZZZZ